MRSAQGLFCVLKKRKGRTFDVRKAPAMAQSPCMTRVTHLSNDIKIKFKNN